MDQLACGMQLGIEGAAHAMLALYDDHSNDGWGFLLMDATNAFNLVNTMYIGCPSECSSFVAKLQSLFVQHV